MADNINKLIKEEGKKTRDHFDVVAENLESKIDAVAEQVGGNEVNITKIQTTLEEHGDRLTAIENTLVAVNLGELVKKVANLESRLLVLEGKQEA